MPKCFVEANGIVEIKDALVVEILRIAHLSQVARQLDPRAGQVLELRYFGGLTEAEAASVLGISVATLRRDWEFGRAFIARQLR